MARRMRMILFAIVSLFSAYTSPLAKIDTTRKHTKPKGGLKISRNREWKDNLHKMNQRQRGLRSLIGRGK